MAAQSARPIDASSPEYEVLRRIFDDAKIGTWEWNASSGAMRWSERFEAQHGFESGGLGASLESHLDRVHVDDRARVRSAFLAIATDGQSLSIDYRVVAPDSSVYDIASEARIPAGGARVIGICSDISDSVLRSRALAQAVPAQIFTAKPDGTVDFINDAARRYFGLSNNSKDSWGEIHPDDIAEAQRTWNHAMSTGQDFELEMRLRAADGEYHWYLSRAIPLRDTNGKIVQWLGTAMDIDARRRLYALMTAQSEIAQLFVDARSLDDVASSVLETYCRNLGWRCAQLWIPDAEAAVVRRIAGWHDATIGESDWSEFAAMGELPRGAGIPGSVWESKSPLWIEDLRLAVNMPMPRAAVIRHLGLRSALGIPLIVRGEVTAILEMFSPEKKTPNDASLQLASSFGQQIGHFIERINAEQELSDALHRLRRLLNVTDAALAHLSLDELLDDMLAKICEALAADMGIVLLADSAQKELEVVASTGAPPKFAQGVRVAFGSFVSGRAAAERTITTARHLSADPSAHPTTRALGVESLAAVPLISGERLVGVLTVGSFADKDFQRDQIDLLQLVAQRMANAIVNSSLYEDARESIRTRDRFLSVASHELRNPITGILGWIEMLRTSSDPTIRAEALDWIEKSAKTQSILIEDLLDATRIREGKLTLRWEPLDLRDVVRNAINIVDNQARGRGVIMESKLPDQPVDLAGDRTRLQQVVWNLLGNAVKFTPPGKHVRTTLEADSSRAKIIVADEGDGINPDFLPHVFEAFEQDSTGKRAGGLGLGLDIVATIVSMHSGTIDAKSDGAGKGATFTVTLPLRVSSV
jgi:PAS domain S-box-containing protein